MTLKRGDSGKKIKKTKKKRGLLASPNQINPSAKKKQKQRKTDPVSKSLGSSNGRSQVGPAGQIHASKTTLQPNPTSPGAKVPMKCRSPGSSLNKPKKNHLLVHPTKSLGSSNGRSQVGPARQIHASKTTLQLNPTSPGAKVPMKCRSPGSSLNKPKKNGLSKDALQGLEVDSFDGMRNKIRG
jgi:hypothetical protein